MFHVNWKNSLRTIFFYHKELFALYFVISLSIVCTMSSANMKNILHNTFQLAWRIVYTTTSSISKKIACTMLSVNMKNYLHFVFSTFCIFVYNNISFMYSFMFLDLLLIFLMYCYFAHTLWGFRRMFSSWLLCYSSPSKLQICCHGFCAVKL